MANPQQFRQMLADNPGRAALGAASILVIVSAAWFAVSHLRAQPTSVAGKVYFIDENTGDISVQPATAIPPLRDARGNPTLVRAYFYSCGGGTEKQPAYYEKYSEQARNAMETAGPELSPEAHQLIYNGRRVRRPVPGSPWIPANSPEGRSITRPENCADGTIPG